MAQSVERRIGSAEVTGPIPVSSLHKETAQALDFSGFALFLGFDASPTFQLFGPATPSAVSSCLFCQLLVQVSLTYVFLRVTINV